MEEVEVDDFKVIISFRVEFAVEGVFWEGSKGVDGGEGGILSDKKRSHEVVEEIKLLKFFDKLG